MSISPHKKDNSFFLMVERLLVRGLVLELGLDLKRLVLVLGLVLGIIAIVMPLCKLSCTVVPCSQKTRQTHTRLYKAFTVRNPVQMADCRTVT